MRWVLLLGFVVSVNAQQWLGSNELGPAPEHRSDVAVASNGAEHLAVWNDFRSGAFTLYAARIAGDGTVVDAEGLIVGASKHAPLVASDGEDYLVVWGEGAARLSDGTIAGRHERAHDRGFALAWNGRHYLLLTHRDYSRNAEAVLLDRDGAIASGMLELAHSSDFLGAASAGGTWMVEWFKSDGVTRYTSILTERDFPPAGGTRLLAPPPAPPASWPFRLASDGHVYVRVQWDERALTIQRFDSEGRPLRRLFSASYAVPQDLREVSVAADRSAVYVAYSARFGTTEVLRVSVGGTTTVQIAGYSVRLSPAPSGLLALAMNRPWRIETALIDRHGAAGEWRLVSASRAAQAMPRLAAAGSARAAAWVEKRAASAIAFLPLDPLGRPLREQPVLLAADQPSVKELWIAGDGGGTFLVLWTSGSSSARGAIVAADGTIVNGPFTIALDRDKYGPPTSLTSARDAYLLFSGERVFRIGRDGALLDPEPRWSSGRFGTYAAADGDELAGAALVYEHCPYFECILPFVWPAFRRDLEPCSGAPCDDGAWTVWQELDGNRMFALDPPDVAAGGGHALAVYQVGLLVDGASTFSEGPYLLAGDDGRLRAAPYPRERARPHVAWNGDGFYVAAGATLTLHAPRGDFIRSRTIVEDALESEVEAGADGGAIVLVQRRGAVPRIGLMQIPRD